MDERASWPLFALLSLVNPFVIVAGVVSGLVIRRWWQVVFGVVATPAAYLLYSSAFVADHYASTPIIPLGLAGGIWTGAVFALKKAWLGSLPS